MRRNPERKYFLGVKISHEISLPLLSLLLAMSPVDTMPAIAQTITPDKTEQATSIPDENVIVTGPVLQKAEKYEDLRAITEYLKENTKKLIGEYILAETSNIYNQQEAAAGTRFLSIEFYANDGVWRRIEIPYLYKDSSQPILTITQDQLIELFTANKDFLEFAGTFVEGEKVTATNHALTELREYADSVGQFKRLELDLVISFARTTNPNKDTSDLVVKMTIPAELSENGELILNQEAVVVTIITSLTIQATKIAEAVAATLTAQATPIPEATVTQAAVSPLETPTKVEPTDTPTTTRTAKPTATKTPSKTTKPDTTRPKATATKAREGL